MGAKVVPELVETSHCTVGFGVPVAAALKLAVSPEATVALEGSVVMTGGAVTVRVAAVVVAEPTELVKTASYSSPFSLVVVVNEYFVEVPPLMGTVEVAPLMGTKVVPELVETSHCTVGAGLPEALDLNLTLLPDAMVTLNGSNVIFGTRFFFADERAGKLTERFGVPMNRSMYARPGVSVATLDARAGDEIRKRFAGDG